MTNKPISRRRIMWAAAALAVVAMLMGALPAQASPPKKDRPEPVELASVTFTETTDIDGNRVWDSTATVDLTNGGSVALSAFGLALGPQSGVSGGKWGYSDYVAPSDYKRIEVRVEILGCENAVVNSGVKLKTSGRTNNHALYCDDDPAPAGPLAAVLTVYGTPS